MSTHENQPQLLRLLGLAVRAGNVSFGVEATRAALHRGSAQCVILAQDASPRCLQKVGRLAHGKGIPVLAGPTAQELGETLGRTAIHAVAVNDPAMSAGMLARATAVTPT